MIRNSPNAKIKRPRILICGGLGVGGTQTHVTVLCRVLIEAGAEVTAASASTNWPADAITDLKALGVRVVVSPFGFGPLRSLAKAWVFLLWPFLLRRDYDVLCCIGVGRVHQWACRFVGKNGWKIYHEIVDCPAPNSVAAQGAVMMDALVANSRTIENRMAERFPGIPVRAIPFLTSSAPMPPPAERRPLAQGLLRIAYLGRLVPHKRPDHLIEAWPLWNARSPIGPARLDLYGGDYNNEGSRLQMRIDELGLKDHVRLRGSYSTRDLPAILNETDIVVLPSAYEGLPLVLVEAMQRGVPVVATSAGGTTELGEDNADVIITEGTDWNKFAAGLETMAERVRTGDIDRTRLHEWTETRYGFELVAEAWRKALLTPETFFAEKTQPVPQVIL